MIPASTHPIPRSLTTRYQTRARLAAGLMDVKAAISARQGQPRLRVHGSKHLSTAFLFGRVFAPYPATATGPFSSADRKLASR